MPPRRFGFGALFAAAIAGCLIAAILVATIGPALSARLPQDQTGVLPGTQVTSSLPPGATSWPVAAVVQKVAPAVVAIHTKTVTTDIFGQRQVQEAAGSGFVVEPSGYIVTNYHVVAGAQQINVTLGDGRVLPARVVGSDPPSDLAVVKVEASGLPTVTFGNSSQLQLGDLAVAIGNALNLNRTVVTAGVISGLNMQLEGPTGGIYLNLVQTDATINPGNSGGPLCNAAGQVIGINSIKIQSTTVAGVGFAIASNYALPIIQQLIRYGQVRRPWLGVGVWDVAQANANGYPITRGVLVVSVTPGSPAAQAGIQPGDNIVAVGGHSIADSIGLFAAIQGYQPGQSAAVTVIRNGKTMNITVTFQLWPANTP